MKAITEALCLIIAGASVANACDNRTLMGCTKEQEQQPPCQNKTLMGCSR